VSSVMRDVGFFLLAVGVIAAAMGLVAFATALWVRRQWRRKRVLLSLNAHALAVSAGAAGVKWLWSRPVPDRRWLSLHRTRRQLHRAVDGADKAVRMARAANAPIGELASLSNRLRAVALDVDKSLRIAQNADGPAAKVDATVAQARELTAAGREIQHAVATSLESSNRPAAQALVDHVRLEIQAVDAGSASS